MLLEVAREFAHIEFTLKSHEEKVLFSGERHSTGTDGAWWNSAPPNALKSPCRSDNKAAPSVALLRLVYAQHGQESNGVRVPCV